LSVLAVMLCWGEWGISARRSARSHPRLCRVSQGPPTAYSDRADAPPNTTSQLGQTIKLLILELPPSSSLELLLYASWNQDRSAGPVCPHSGHLGMTKMFDCININLSQRVNFEMVIARGRFTYRRSCGSARPHPRRGEPPRTRKERPARGGPRRRTTPS